MKTVCISHKEDLDGLGAAALVKQATGAKTILVDYMEKMDVLRNLSSLDATDLYICDLGTSVTEEEEFCDILKGQCDSGVNVTYIDHHAISDKTKKKLINSGVVLVHDIQECTSVQVFFLLREKLSSESFFTAACAAVTDYMEDKPKASDLLMMTDRSLALYNSSILYYHINSIQDRDDLLQKTVSALSKDKTAFEISGASGNAEAEIMKVMNTVQHMKNNHIKMNGLAYYEASVDAGSVINFMPGITGRQICVSYRKTNNEIYAVSVRGPVNGKIHLGKLVGRIANAHGGTGGGHSMACGAGIPIGKIKPFLNELNKNVI